MLDFFFVWEISQQKKDLFFSSDVPKPLIGVTTFSYEDLNFAFMTVGTLIIVFNIRIFQIGVHKSIDDLEKSMLKEEPQTLDGSCIEEKQAGIQKVKAPQLPITYEI